MRVLMVPHLSQFRREESGIRRVIEAYFRHLPRFGVEMAGLQEPYDLMAVHAGSVAECDVLHCHGLYWTADYQASAWEWQVNARVVANARKARAITVPSDWVAETFRRDMRLDPHVVPHGIDWEEWALHDEPKGEYALWNKNRVGDVCDPSPLLHLARRFPKGEIVTTFAPRGAPRNVVETGIIPHAEMKKAVQSALVYLATTKETGAISVLEAMAAGVPVLAYDHGAAALFVEHGVNGYLARPGDLEDLAEGMAWCAANHEVLGVNGREMARRWTWERACEEVAAIYAAAMEEEPPTAAVVIPSYNYAHLVGRAVESAMAQTFRGLVDIVVVDDGSEDGGETERAVRALAEKDARVRYVRQGNAGVAVARNRGVSETRAKYVCCLDADDWIRPRFLEACVDALEADRSLGIAYTGLWYVKPNGEEGLSPWPWEFNYDDSLKRKNQIPTGCVFRREMWARLGGYRQRYAPGGAGEEDAEFWVRAGAYGWGARKVTDEGLFVYSWLSGQVSGGRTHREHGITDWLAWHPWAEDGQHPFASLATPKRFSHPVRAYDEPLVSVVVPVGPGHGREVVNALDSLEGQTFRKWEAIVVDDTGDGLRASLGGAFPYVRWVEAGGGEGAGRARNLGAAEARGPLLLFLDADDWLYGNHALVRMVDAWALHEAVAYGDYYGRAFVGEPDELDPKLKERIVRHDERTGESVLGYVAFEFDCERARAQPEGPKPYVWCNITALHPTAWWREVGGFDEEMPSWEDWDYWVRLARAGKCFVRVPEPLMVYKFHTGTRRDEGVRLRAELVDYLAEKYRGEVAVGNCTNCPKRRVPSRQASRGVFEASTAGPARGGTGQVARMGAAAKDEDFVMIQYNYPKGGSHRVLGQAMFPQPLVGIPMEKAHGRQGWLIHYGVWKRGDRFLVHREDARLAPHIFTRVEEPVPVPDEREGPPPPPERIAGEPGEPEAGETPGPEAPAAVAPLPREFGPEAGAPVPEAGRAGPPPVPRRAGAVAPAGVPRLDLQALPGINRAIAAQLEALGATTAGAVVDLGEEGLRELDGVGEKRAAMILGATRRMLEEAQARAEAAQAEAAAGEPG